MGVRGLDGCSNVKRQRAAGEAGATPFIPVVGPRPPPRPPPFRGRKKSGASAHRVSIDTRLMVASAPAHEAAGAGGFGQRVAVERLVMLIDVVAEFDGAVARHPAGEIDPGDRHFVRQVDDLGLRRPRCRRRSRRDSSPADVLRESRRRDRGHCRRACSRGNRSGSRRRTAFAYRCRACRPSTGSACRFSDCRARSRCRHPAGR